MAKAHLRKASAFYTLRAAFRRYYSNWKGSSTQERLIMLGGAGDAALGRHSFKHRMKTTPKRTKTANFQVEPRSGSRKLNDPSAAGGRLLLTY